MKKTKKLKPNYVLCVGCNKPIHIDDFGGLFSLKGVKGLFMVHNNVVCLARWFIIKDDLEKEAQIKKGVIEK